MSEWQALNDALFCALREGLVERALRIHVALCAEEAKGGKKKKAGNAAGTAAVAAGVPVVRRGRTGVRVALAGDPHA